MSLKEQPLSVSVDDERLTISIGVEALCRIVSGNWAPAKGYTPPEVVNAAGFAEEIADMLAFNDPDLMGHPLVGEALFPAFGEAATRAIKAGCTKGLKVHG